MPELPEVETVMQGFKAAFLGQKIKLVHINRPDLRWPFPEKLKETLENHTPVSFHRRAKYILMRMNNGWSTILHLGMSGRLVISKSDITTSSKKHEHLILLTENGNRAGLIDPRRFGSVDLIETDNEDNHRSLRHLGIEPLSNQFSGNYLDKQLKHRRSPIKNILLDQKIVVGLGNIYVCEALFLSHVHPERLSCSLSKKEISSLVSNCKKILLAAIHHGGSTLRDYVQSNGQKGDFQNLHLVYGQEGKPCTFCGGKHLIKRITQSGRSTFFCDNCQK